MRSLTTLFSRRALLAASGLAVGAAALGDAGFAAAQEPLKIGIIGTGNIGGALARYWGSAGHEVFMSSRHPEELEPLAKELGPRAHVGTPREAAAFGSVVLVSVPYGAMRNRWMGGGLHAGTFPQRVNKCRRRPALESCGRSGARSR